MFEDVCLSMSLKNKNPNIVSVVPWSAFDNNVKEKQIEFCWVSALKRFRGSKVEGWYQLKG